MKTRFKTKNGWVVFKLPEGSPPLTDKTVDESEAADYAEEIQKTLPAT